jgi:hypothetical protein
MNTTCTRESKRGRHAQEGRASHDTRLRLHSVNSANSTIGAGSAVNAGETGARHGRRRLNV